MRWMSSFMGRGLWALLVLCLGWGDPAMAERQAAGVQVGFPTTVTFTVDEILDTRTVDSNIPFLTILPIRSSSELTILRRAPVTVGGAGTEATIGAVEYATDPENGNDAQFRDQDATLTAVDRRETLVPASGFQSGETMFFHLRDTGLNHRPTVAEQVLVSFETSSGDRELFKLTASGPDSPDFYGYAPTVNVDALHRGDGRLAVARNGTVEARYEDSFDQTDIRVAVAVIDPAMRVFDTSDGSRVDGARIRVVFDESGKTAPVYSMDGTEERIETIISGSGTPPVSGEASIPFLMPGRYRLLVEPPSGHVFPSDTPYAEIAALSGGDFRLLPGSRGTAFEIENAGPPVFDIPLDPRLPLFLRQTVEPSETAVGDTVVLTLELRNDDDRTAHDIKIDDLLPPGLRPRAHDGRFDAASGRLALTVPRLDPGEAVTLHIPARVGVDAVPGLHEATASARAALGYRSNPARARFTVTDPLGTDISRILGTVTVGACGAQGIPIRTRLITQKGTLIETDREGRFRIEGLEPGRQVLRLDETSLPEGLVPVACSSDLSPGDRAHMRLVETRGGLARLVRFRLRDTRPAPPAPVSDAPVDTPPSAGDVKETSSPIASAPATALPAPAAPVAPKTDYTTEDLAAFDTLTLVYPMEGSRLTRPLFEIGIAYPFGHTINLEVNGAPLEEARYDGIIGNKEARIAMRRWKGVRGGKGPVTVTVTMDDKQGKRVAEIMRHFGDGTGAPPKSPPKSPPKASAAESSPPSPRPAVFVPRPRTSEDLASLPMEFAIIHPPEGSAVRAGRFDLEVSLPFGMAIEAAVDGTPIDLALSQNPLVNRKARLSVRRWTGIPTGPGNDPVTITVTATARDGAKRVLTRTLNSKRTTDPLLNPQEVPNEEVVASRTDGLPPGLPRALQVVYPEEGASLADPSLRLGIAHPMGTRLRVTLNGQPLGSRSIIEGAVDRKAGLVMTRWQGVDLPDGMTLIEASTLGPDDAVLETITRRVHYVTTAAEAIFLPDESTLIADGTTAPVLAVRLVDGAGRPLHDGRRVSAVLAPPYRAAQSFDRFEEDPLAASGSTRVTLVAGEDGIARLTLRPTTRSGEVDLRVRFAGSGEARLRPWLAAAARPWIVVGLAEGTIGHTTIAGNMEAAERAGVKGDTFTDGRLAFYAKGAIRGDWLLTLAYDSDADFDEDDVNDRIDPDAYYPVYGDASLREDGAQSRYPLYVRLERRRFYALFGDYDTGLNRTELGAYSRQMSGFKTVYEGNRVSLVAFAAEADRQFRRREFEANRGIGPYALDADIARNSETVRLVTRRREELDEVISETVLAPFLDYDIDYTDGLLTLRLPPDAVDVEFNPVFIEVDYERAVADAGTITAGGRAAMRLWDDRAEIGVTVVHEEGGSMDASGDLIAVDATVTVTDDLEIEAEIAASRMEEDGETREGTAFRAEARYVREGWSARAYVHQSEPGFGVASQSVAQAGRRTVGAELRARVTASTDPNGAGILRYEDIDLTARVISDADLSSEARRDSVEALVTRDVDLGTYGQGTASIGYRGEQDTTAHGRDGRAHRVIGRMTANLLSGRAQASIERDQTVTAKGTTAPDATRFGLRAALTPRIDGMIGVEVFDSGPDKANLTAGIQARPWTGGSIDAGLTASRPASPGFGQGDRINASLGVQQEVRITDALTATLQATRTQPLGGSTSPVADALFSNVVASNGPTTSLAAGLGYAARGWQASVRVDGVDADETQTVTLRGAVKRDVSKQLTVAGGFDTRFADPGTTDTRATLAGSYRSLDGRLAVLQRFELAFGDSAGATRSAIHSLTVSRAITDRLTLSGAHALRYRRTKTDGWSDRVWTQFVAGDVTYRFRDDWQVGLHGDALANLDASEARYAFGGSIGYAPRDGMLLSLGYNLAGFNDDDFEETHYTRQGPYLRLSIAFDENDIINLAKSVGSVMPMAAAD